MKKLLLCVLLAACTGDVDDQWQLSHDRVIAVRASPPGIASGEKSTIDALLGFEDQAPMAAQPDMAAVVSPPSLSGTLTHEADGWTVTSPSEEQLAAARTELGLDAGAPVPLQVQVTFAATGLSVLKGIILGEHADNPVLDPVTIDGMDALAETELSVKSNVDIPVAVEFDETYNINWLTSCGQMHDFDLAHAYLRVEDGDPHDGTFGIVVRDGAAGIAWKFWPITAQ
ncbi:MAG TPA: hypothetical protein VGM39_18295 [Kofleriaceae bacterium]